MKVVHENNLLQSQIEIQEHTFQNISREIHDNIGQKLTLVKLHLNMINLKNNIPDHVKSNDSIQLLGEVISDLSDISRSLSSELILHNGLVKGLEFEIDHLMKLNMYKVSLEITGETLFLEAKKELMIFRIVQEALNNIVKHAKAGSIWVHLHFNSEIIQLIVKDDGIGFSPSQVNGKSSGLNNMRKRATSLNGQCKVITDIKNGTEVNIQIPAYDN
jgi:signal transduction histidine kinase